MKFQPNLQQYELEYIFFNLIFKATLVHGFRTVNSQMLYLFKHTYKLQMVKCDTA